MLMVGRYLVSHWQGRQPLYWSYFVNGVFAYILVTLFLIQLYQLVRLEVSNPIALSLMLVFLAWAGVGIVRAAIRHIVHHRDSLPQKVFGSSTIFSTSLVAVFILADVYILTQYL